MRRIESRNNPYIIQIGKLTSRKHREDSGLFFFEGAHLLEEFLRFGHQPETVFVTDRACVAYASLLAKIPEELLCAVPDAVFAKLSTEQSPQGILTVAKLLPGIRSVTDASQTPGRVLLLESVRDNGNVGTVIRTATALGWSVVLSFDCADLFSPKTVRATMGTLFAGKVFLCEDACVYARSFAHQNRRIFSAALSEQSRMLGAFDLQPDDCFVIGNEGQGVSDALLSDCTGSVLIPMTGMAESLNASVAAAVIMWEGARTDQTLQEGGAPYASGTSR